MKKIIFILSLILIIPNVFTLSLFGAQDISKNYILENEMIDSYTQPKIVCEDEEYFVIPIVNSLGESILFIPISIENSQVIISETDSFNVQLIKTEYLLKLLTNSSSNNYLSFQLIDRIDSFINVLNSKKAQLTGVYKKDYSFNINEQLTITINKIDVLIKNLESLKSNLNDLLESQNEFLQTPNCNNVNSFLNSFQTSFEGYNEITNLSTEYVQSTDQLITRIVSDKSISSQEVSGIINLISVPSNLNSQINNISESLSSTSSFYSNIALDLKGNSGDLKIQLFIDNLKLRKDFITLNNILEKYDSSFPNYSNLKSAVKTVLDSDYKSYWKEQEDVVQIQKIYNEILEHKENAQYQRAISKTDLLKTKTLNVLDSGFQETTDDNEFGFTYYLIIGIIILVLIIILIFLKKRKSKKYKKNNFKQKKSKKSEDDFLNFEDPF